MALQNIVIRSQRGIASTLEALAIIGHYQRLYGPEAFVSFRAPRDPFTSRHYGYLTAQTDPDTATKILGEPSHYIPVKLPCQAADIHRHRSTLAEVLEAMRARTAPSTEEMDGQVSGEAIKSQEKVLQVTASRGDSSAAVSQRPKRGSTKYPRPRPQELHDLLHLFDGFAKPGRLRSDWQSRAAKPAAKATETDDLEILI